MPHAAPLAFFSYSRQDSEFVLKLAKDLRDGGAAVWLDQLDIEPGQRWDSTVEQALAKCPRMLLVLSPSSVDSTNVMDEVSFALEEGKLVIPVLYQDCKIPFRLRRVQYIDSRKDYQGGLRELLRMLGVKAPEAGPQAAAVVTPPVAPEVKPPAPTPVSEEVTVARVVSPPIDAKPAEVVHVAAKPAEIVHVPAAPDVLPTPPAGDVKDAIGKAPIPAATERREPEPPAVAPVVTKREEPAARPADPLETPRVVMPPTLVTSASGGSRRMLILGGVAAFVMLGGAVGIWKASRPGETPKPPVIDPVTPVSPTPTPGDQSKTGGTEAKGVKDGDIQPKPEVAGPRLDAQWVTKFMEASQGPSVLGLRPYFHDRVDPYYAIPSADWAAIERDKRAFFKRWPTIRLSLVGEPKIKTTGQDGVVDVDMTFENVRNDGVRAEGSTQVQMQVRLIEGSWKIVGIRERKLSDAAVAGERPSRQSPPAR